jgi:hypothetical protein
VLPSSTSHGLANLVQGKADIAMLAEPLATIAARMNGKRPGFIDLAAYEDGVQREGMDRTAADDRRIADPGHRCRRSLLACNGRAVDCWPRGSTGPLRDQAEDSARAQRHVDEALPDRIRAHHQPETHSQAGAHPADHTGTAEPQTTATSRPRKAENEALHQAKEFAVARLQPEEAAATDIRAVIKEYTAWCKEAGAKRLPVEEITTAFDRLFAIEKSGRCYVLTGVAMRLDGGEEMARLH